MAFSQKPKLRFDKKEKFAKANQISFVAGGIERILQLCFCENLALILTI